MQLDHSEYIKEVTIPFTVKVFSEEQITILERLSFQKLPVLYSAVVPTETERIVPIFEMVSSCHYAKDIFKLFYEFLVCILRETI